MIQTVVKRDGRIVGFNEEKIITAIRKAMLHTEKGEDRQLLRQITDHIAFKGSSQMTVEAIQDAVEMELMKSSRKDVAQKYIAYRNQRSIARKAKTRDMFLEIINIKSNDVTRENANMNADTPAGMMMKFSSETTKPFVDDYLLSPEVKEAVANNYLHIHDKDYYPTKSLTCVQHPLDRILKHGFSAGHGESRPAKRIETASILGCISLETAQNEMHGGQAIPAFDFYLAPYVRLSYIEEVKILEELYGQDFSELYQAPIDDYLLMDLNGMTGVERVKQHAINQTIARVHQSMEAFIHNMNTIHSRGGNQVVFSSINYGTDTSAEGRCIIRELLKSTYQGVGNGLEVKKTWPESDLEMMQLTLPEYVGDAPFHTYYMTVSGHMNYNYMGNSMSAKHKNEVAYLGLSEAAGAYLACQMELDKALEYTLQYLEETGHLEDTVLCLSADHYPYGLEQETLTELNGGEPVDMRFDVYHSTLILWCGSMTEPVHITKPCSSLDILPTLSNLFGLTYDSRLLMGRDILSDSEGLVVLSDRSFLTESGRYDAAKDTFTPAPGVTVPEGYVKSHQQTINGMFSNSRLILEQDYYRKLGLSHTK